MNWTPELVFEGLNPPVIISKDVHTNYVVNGGKWYDAPLNVTLDMVRSQWKRWRPKGYIENTVAKYTKFRSSSSDAIYTVSEKNGFKTCDCPGFTYRKKCKHVN